MPEGKLAREDIVALGDTTSAGIATKARFVMDLMEARVLGLGVDWSMASALDIYTIHPIEPILAEVVLQRCRPADDHGVRWHYTRPPIEEIEYEMDLRGVRTELRLDA